MKRSRQIVPVTLILFLIFASGCSKNLFRQDDLESDRLLGANSLEGVAEESAATPSASGPEEKSVSGQSFATAQEGGPGTGSAESLGAEPFSGEGGGLTGDGGEAPAPGSGLSGGETAGERDVFSGLYEKPGSPRDFGSAAQGMPGNGSAGSFSAEPFSGERGGEGSGLPADGGEKTPAPGPGLLKEETVGERDVFSGLYEKPGSPRDFGSAAQGMPGNGSTGSFSAEPFSGERGGEGSGLPADAGAQGETPEPFLPEKGEDQVASLPQEEEALRLLPFRPSDSLKDIHFAFDKHDLDDHSRAILQENAAYLEAHPAFRIEIQGHCDERGSNNYNISLGERRARSTKSYLVSLGIDKNRIRTISYGEEKPFCLESNEKCWYQNRRAHFVVAE